MNRLHAFLSSFVTPEEINGGDLCPTYMYRWPLLTVFGWKVYVHRFVADDWSRDLHDHPKRFISIGLWGSYVEETPARFCPTQEHHEERMFRAPWVRTFPATHIHRVRLAVPGRECWTLVIVGRPVRPWGFWHLGDFIPWRTYVGSDTARRMKACE